MSVIYKIDGVDLKTYGVYVSGSVGLLSRPKMKKPVVVNWDGYNGEVVDLSRKCYESRQIELQCFIKAETKAEFITKCNTFLSLFDQAGLHRLYVSVDGSEPLLYEVYAEEALDVKKTWTKATMVGTFSLKLNEPEPVKRVLKYTRTGDANKTVSITVTSAKLLNVYWGDGSHTYDVNGTAVTITHTYSVNGTYYIVITGNIDEITTLTSTATTVWNKL